MFREKLMIKLVANPVSAFKKLPLKTKQLLGLGIVFALFIALPLFVWAISTQRFELRERAQMVDYQLAITTNSFIDGFVGEGYRNFFYGEATGWSRDPELTLTVTNLPSGFSVPPELCGTSYPISTTMGPVKRAECALDGLPTEAGTFQITVTLSDSVTGESVTKEIPLKILSSIAITCSGGRADEGKSCEYEDCPPVGKGPCKILTGTCRSGQCVGKELSDVCITDSDCGCGIDPTTGQCSIDLKSKLSGICNAPDFCSGISGNLFPGCVNGQCTLKSQPNTCPRGPQGNLNCDPSGIINEIDLARLLLLWRPSVCVGEIQPPDPAFRHPDLNGDCYINEVDLAILLLNWRTN